MSITLKPGVYLAVRRLEKETIGSLAKLTDLFNLSLGHQFVVCVIKDKREYPCRKYVDLGGGNVGFVLSGFPDKQGLLKYFENGGGPAASDRKYLRNFLNQNGVTNGLKLAMSKNVSPTLVDATIKRVVHSARHYNKRTDIYPVAYSGGGNNSNAWAQNLIKYNLGEDAVPGDFNGYWSESSGRKLEKHFFKSTGAAPSISPNKHQKPKANRIGNVERATDRPTPGRFYVVKKGDATLGHIAVSAYGKGKSGNYTVILKHAENDHLSRDGRIYNGVRLYIPKL